MKISSQRRHIAVLITLFLFNGDKMASLLLDDPALAQVRQPPSAEEVDAARAKISDAKTAAERMLDQHEINQTTRARTPSSVLAANAAELGLRRRDAEASASTGVRNASYTPGGRDILSNVRRGPSILAAVRERQASSSPRTPIGQGIPAFPTEEDFNIAAQEIRSAAQVDPSDMRIHGRLNTAPRKKTRTNIQTYDDLIAREAGKYGIDPALVKGVIYRESYFNPEATSSAGAQGLMQLMPPTARDMGVRDPFDPAQNIAGGVRYLNMLLQRYNGDEAKALAAYNAGMKHVDDYGGVPPFKETREYVEAVIGHRDHFRNLRK